jgi:hypothetical protein
VAKLFEGKKRINYEAGARIIKEKLNKLAEIAPNGEPIDFERLLLIKKGDLVPEEFRKLSGIKCDSKGIAQASYADGWCQSHWNKNADWDNCWGECWDNSKSMPIEKSMYIINSLNTKVAAFNMNEFNEKERLALVQFGIKG